MNKTIARLWRARRVRVWAIVTVTIMSLVLTASLVATQVEYFANTIDIVLGGERRVLVSGNPDQYIYYEPDYGSKSQTLQHANQLNQRIAEEGTVLLANNGALPLASGARVSVFGRNSVDLVYGGSGSGGGNTSGAVTINQSLESAGLVPNPVLRSFYASSASGSGRPKTPSQGSILYGFGTGETPQSAYTAAVRASYADYNDAALIVFSRIGGEGFDLPRAMRDTAGARSPSDHYLQLDQNEADLIAAVGAAFDDIIIVLNSSSPMELGFVDDPTHYAHHPNISAVLWIGSPGISGAMALGRILTGEVNPSGRLVDTFARDFRRDPSWANFAENMTSGGNRYSYPSMTSGAGDTFYFIDYEEGIYVGYRYYETRGAVDGESWYQQNVVFPFGYGLSYTTFDWQLESSSRADGSSLASNEKLTFDIRVTNTGPVAGREVVQLYYTAPYTSGAIEKSHIVLADFAKSDLLQPTQSQVLTLSVQVRDMASYDYDDANQNSFAGWELDGGSYVLSVRRNAHDQVLCHNYTVPSQGYCYQTDEVTGTEVVNRFDDVSGHIKQYLSRDDFDGTWPTAPTSDDRSVSDAFIAAARYSSGDAGQPWYADTAPKQAKSKLSSDQVSVFFWQLRGLDYDDPLWDQMLDQLTLREMAGLIGSGAFSTAYLENIQKPKTIDPDGPAGFNIFMGDSEVYDTCYYASECVIAATWNTDLVFEMGVMIGNEGIWGNADGDGRPYSGWYAPAVNIHRSQFSGRNFEYYSEDGLLSGAMAAAACQGAATKGVYTYVKHFALNDQETHREANGLLTWANEQSMRELYFLPFELAVKDGGTTAIMSSFNRIGAVWAGGSYALLTQVLREEWGFVGMVISDYNTGASYMNPNQMIRAGGDLNLANGIPPSFGDNSSATQVTALRRATKNIFFAVANSNASNGLGEGVFFEYQWPLWVAYLFWSNVALALALALWGAGVIWSLLRRTAQPGTEVTA